MTDIFGTGRDGQTVTFCDLHAGGARARILSWGATLQDYRIADVDHGLVLGGDSVDAYLGPMLYFGAIVGPVANRIAGGQMQIGGQTFDLDKNEAGRTTLHGGCAGYSGRNWTFRSVSDAACQLVLQHPNGLGGFPGPIVATTTYRLDASGALEIEITGQSDADTYFSPAFHGYWNLSEQADLSDHLLTVPAESYLPVDQDQIPLGDAASVSGTGFDYRKPRSIGAVLDHNFCISPPHNVMRPVCWLSASGLVLEVQADQPGVQIYNGADIDTGQMMGHGSKPYGRYAGLAIEPQFWPDTPNQRGYPSSLLRAGQTSRHRMRFQVTKAI